MALKLQSIPHPQQPPSPQSETHRLSFQPLKPPQNHPTNSHSFSINHGPPLSILEGPVNSSTYASVLQSCKSPALGKQVHAHSLKNGFHGQEFVETKLLLMYGKCGCFKDATQLFDKMPMRNVYSWTAILGVYVDYGFFEGAASLFLELIFEGLELDFFVFPIVLKIASACGGIELGRQLHCMVIKNGFVENLYVGNSLIDMYGKCGELDGAKNFFDGMPERDCVSWNSVVSACAANGMVYEALQFLETMSVQDDWKPDLVSWNAVISGFSQNGYNGEAVEMLYKMQAAGFQANAHTLSGVLPACARLRNLSLGKEINGYITRKGYMSNPIVVNGLVDMYRKCADMKVAFKVFSKFSVKNVVSFNTMIVGYCENREIFKAKQLFDRMKMAGIEKDIISWNSIISGYANNFMFDEALSMFEDLLMEERIEPDSLTLGSVLTACANTRSLRAGKEIHSRAIVRGLRSDPFVGEALVEFYCKCNDLKAARMALSEVKERDTSIWNALISGYAHCSQFENVKVTLQQMKEDGLDPNVYTWNGIIAGHVENGRLESALELIREMEASNLQPDVYTIVMILRACSRLATLERGKQVHAHSVRFGYESDAYIGAALVDMYAKCGSFNHVRLAYDRIAEHNLVTRNSMLTAYAMHGYGEEGIAFFRKMLIEGSKPDSFTFLSVLSSCVHAGAIEAGHEFFKLMGSYDCYPTLKHYTCMVDLLSRAGQLDEAYDIIQNMSVKADVVIWGALLGGCMTHGNLDLGEIAAERLLALEPDNTGNYVMLANLYACTGQWSDLAKVRRIIKEKEMRKNPGCSWIEDRDSVHVFLASDRSHDNTEEIYATLDSLTALLRLEQD